MVITGGGEGIMGAAQRGAGRDNSFGLNIRLPFEQEPNIEIAGDRKLINFKYFFTRKLCFIKESDAIVLFPGGFGTHDEGFEALTLMQTGKSQPKPLVFVDRPRGNYWKTWWRFVEDQLLDEALISKEDLALFKVTDDVEEACAEITQFYSNYHSFRYVKDAIVVRVKYPVTDNLLRTLNARFSDICLNGGQFQRVRPAARRGERARVEGPAPHRLPVQPHQFRPAAVLDRRDQPALAVDRRSGSQATTIRGRASRLCQQTTSALAGSSGWAESASLLSRRGLPGDEPAVVDAADLPRRNPQQEQHRHPPIHQRGPHDAIGVPPPPAGDQSRTDKREPPRAPQSPRERNVFHDRNLGEPAQRLEHLPPDENALVAVRQPQPARPAAGHPRDELAQTTAANRCADQTPRPPPRRR